ncbi:recombinase family protein [Bacillus sp. S13(2024)]|uniref:recombinase family protein n=1 Tax=Bacillus sp. S13(2024) TaxID=3162885 RepID=UPI003D1DF2E3
MGDNPNRPALNSMLAMLKKEEIGEVVIVYDSDRLARDNFLQRFILNQIIQANATLKIVQDEAFDPFDENSMLSFNIKGALAEYMKKKILSESKRGRMTKVKKHKKMMGVNRIYGYTFDKDEDILVINNEEKK